MAKLFEPIGTHIPRQCWDREKKRWRDCNEVVIQNFRGIGKSKNCCVDGCCLDCKDLAEIQNQFSSLNALLDLPFQSPTYPEIEITTIENIIFAFNYVNTLGGYPWVIEDGVGLRNTVTGKVCNTWNSFSTASSTQYAPYIQYIIFHSKSNCPDFAMVAYVNPTLVPGTSDYYFVDVSPISVCTNWLEAYWDEDRGLVVCNNCTSLIPNRCIFKRTVIDPLPVQIYYEQNYTVSFELTVTDCCKDKLVSVTISPNPYIDINPNPSIFAISPGTNLITVNIDALSGSGINTVSAFLFVRSGCAETTIPLKTFT